MSSEQEIYDSGRVERALELLAERGLTFEADGALWLRHRLWGRRGPGTPEADGSYTYLVPDMAYHINKRDRGFERVINVWGADRPRYIPRMRAVAALSYPPSALVPLVKVVRGGKR